MFGFMNGNHTQNQGAGSTAPRTAGRPRSRIGLALGSGAARGWAHIGVLRALEEIGVRPDIVVGTSIGAVVGSCYCAGLLDGVEAFARRLTRRKVFGFLDVNFSGGGLFTGNKMTRLLDTEFKDKRIEDLDPAFVCVTTELSTGHEIWIRRGSLVSAIRASYAIPGLFQPILINGRWLVDGAIVNPIPVSVCRAFGAEIVIAVNLSSDVFGRGTIIHDPPGDGPEAALPEADAPDESGGNLRRQLVDSGQRPPGLTSVVIEAYNIIQDRIARSRLAGDPPDILVGPRLGSIGHFEFHRAEEAIDVGYKACMKSAAEIEQVVKVFG
jgi:NTE family protein